MTSTAELTADRVDHRFWYGTGLSGNSCYAEASKDSLPSASEVATRLLGLPMALDLPDRDIDRVVSAVARGIARA